MDFGVHLPLIDFDGAGYSWERLAAYVRAARDLGFHAIAANDHLLFSSPWLDGPTALAATLGESAPMDLMTTLALPVLRQPVVLAKTLSALDVLSGGRMIAGVGPGSSARDYAAVGIPFEERWSRFDEATTSLRILLGHGEPVAGRHHATEDLALEPRPVGTRGIPIWIGSWGSEAGLRRVARLGDGWLASGYNVTPASLDASLTRLRPMLRSAGKDPEAFPNALATVWFDVADTKAETDAVYRDILVRATGRDEEYLRERLPVGSVELVVRRLAALQDAGARRILLWPVRDELRQLHRFADEILPALHA